MGLVDLYAPGQVPTLAKEKEGPLAEQEARPSASPLFEVIDAAEAPTKVLKECHDAADRRNDPSAPTQLHPGAQVRVSPFSNA